MQCLSGFLSLDTQIYKYIINTTLKLKYQNLLELFWEHARFSELKTVFSIIF